MNLSSGAIPWFDQKVCAVQLSWTDAPSRVWRIHFRLALFASYKLPIFFWWSARMLSILFNVETRVNELLSKTIFECATQLKDFWIPGESHKANMALFFFVGISKPRLLILTQKSYSCEPSIFIFARARERRLLQALQSSCYLWPYIGHYS